MSKQRGGGEKMTPTQAIAQLNPACQAINDLPNSFGDSLATLSPIFAVMAMKALAGEVTD